MNQAHSALPHLVLNRALGDFLAAEPGCCAIGLVEESGTEYGFLALRPAAPIPKHALAGGFQLGHSLVGKNDQQVLVHFGFPFLRCRRIPCADQSQ